MRKKACKEAPSRYQTEIKSVSKWDKNGMNFLMRSPIDRYLR